MRDGKKNIIVDFTFQFSLNLVEYGEHPEADKKFMMARQLLRLGTLIGAIPREAQNAESKTNSAKMEFLN